MLARPPALRPPALWVILASALLSSAGCAAPTWNGTVDRWGTLREVLRDGDDSGKVEVVRVLTSRGVHGIGALEGLAGEIAISEGIGRVSRGSPTGVIDRPARLGDRAALLVVARVPSWRTHELAVPLSGEALAAWVEAQIAGTSLERFPVIPIRVVGRFAYSGHILAGSCPYASESRPGDSPPIELTGESRVTRTIVGFYADLPPGELTHHASRLHLHALERGGRVGHIDTFTLEAGCRVLLPTY